MIVSAGYFLRPGAGDQVGGLDVGPARDRALYLAFTFDPDLSASLSYNANGFLHPGVIKT